LATITTNAITSITGTSAISGGNVSNDGGTLLTQRGICYGTSPSPTTANTTIMSGSGVGSFTSNITGLTANTTYYVRAYANNSAGTSYGNELSFTTTAGSIVSNPGAGVTFDGFTYASIVLGNGQEWMAENLRTSSYANGDPIQNLPSGAQWNASTIGTWVYYGNDNLNENPYGKLYNRYSVNDTRNVCPSGWHVPSDSDWTTLIDYLGGADVAGGKIKNIGTTYWLSPNTGATDEIGFSGLPGGIINPGGFNSINTSGAYWTSTIGSNPKDLDYQSGWISTLYPASDNWGVSVRCLKD
jgi:uncharacterized protein (TIGR02145 family)